MNENSEDGKVTLDVDVASSLKAAFCAAGWNMDQVKMLAKQSYHLSALREVVEGYAQIGPREFELDLGTKPSNPKGLQMRLVLKTHIGTGTAILTRVGEKLYLDGSGINLFVCKGQRRGCLSGTIEKAMKGKKVLNANFAEFLVSHPFMIPKPWYKFSQIFFWGSRYSSEGYGEYVPTLWLPSIGDMYVQYEIINYDSGTVIWRYCPSAIVEC